MTEIKIGDIVRRKDDPDAAMVLSIDRDTAEVRYIKRGGTGAILVDELVLIASATQQEGGSNLETTTTVLLEIIHDSDIEWWQAIGIHADVYYNNNEAGKTFIRVAYQRAP